MKKMKFIEKINSLLYLEKISAAVADKKTEIEYDHKKHSIAFIRDGMRYVLNIVNINTINMSFDFSHVKGDGNDYMPNTKVPEISFFNLKNEPNKEEKSKIKKDVDNILTTINNWVEKTDFDPEKKKAIIKELKNMNEALVTEIISGIKNTKK